MTSDPATPAGPDDLVFVESLSRDEGWHRHYGLSYGVTTRAIAEVRISIARRIWPGRDYRMVPVGQEATDYE